MKANSLKSPVLIAVLVGLTWFLGCGGPKQTVQNDASSEEAADIDELLGLKEEPEAPPESENLAEDDVLKLLGVTEEGQPAKDQGTKAPAGAEALDESVPERREIPSESSAPKTTTSSSRQPEASTAYKEAEPDVVKPAPQWKGSTFDERYQEALQDYRARRYRDAIQKFESLLDEDARNELADNCQYWIGESYWGMSNYQQAIVAFYKVFSFNRSNKNPDSQLKIGLCYMRMNENEKAKEELQKVIDNYPASEFVGTAKRFLKQLEN